MNRYNPDLRVSLLLRTTMQIQLTHKFYS